MWGFVDYCKALGFLFVGTYGKQLGEFLGKGVTSCDPGFKSHNAVGK